MRSSLLALSLLGLATIPAARPGDEKHPALGLALTVPSKYTPLPVQPTEPWVVLRYVSERKRDAAKDPFSGLLGTVQTKLQILRIDWHDDPVPLPTPPPITTFKRYVEQQLGTWEIAHENDVPEREGWTCKEYELQPRLGDPAVTEVLTARVTQWACELRNAERTWVVLGSCAHEDADKEIRAWRRCAESLEF